MLVLKDITKQVEVYNDLGELKSVKTVTERVAVAIISGADDRSDMPQLRDNFEKILIQQADSKFQLEQFIVDFKAQYKLETLVWLPHRGRYLFSNKTGPFSFALIPNGIGGLTVDVPGYHFETEDF